MVSGIVRGVSVVFLGQITGMVTKGLLILVLTRFLFRPAQYGRLSLVLSVLAIAMLFANLGFEKAGARYVTEYRRDAPELVSTAVRVTLRYNGAAIAVVCASLYLFHDWVARIVGEPAIAGLLLLGVGYVAAKSLKGTAVMLFQGFNRMRLVAVINILTNVLLLVAVPALVALDFGLRGALVGYVASYTVGAAFGLGIISTRFCGGDRVDETQASAVSSRILRYSVPLTFTMGSNVINTRADAILLSIFRGPVAIAFYTLGKQVADFLITPARSLGFAISPTYGEQKAEDDLRTAGRLYERSFIYTITLYGPVAAGIVLVAVPAITLVFGGEYAGAGPVLQIFGVFVFVRALDTITSDALDYLGRARARAVAKGVSTVANVTLNLVLIPPFGAIGAAVATVSTYCLLVAVELFVIVDELPLDPRRMLRSTATVGGITAGMSVVVYPLVGAVSDIPSLAGVVAAGCLAWAGFTAVSGVIDLRRLYTTIT